MVSLYSKKSIREKFGDGKRKYLESWTLYESLYEYLDFRSDNRLIVNDFRRTHVESDFILRKDY